MRAKQVATSFFSTILEFFPITAITEQLIYNFERLLVTTSDLIA